MMWWRRAGNFDLRRVSLSSNYFLLHLSRYICILLGVILILTTANTNGIDEHQDGSNNNYSTNTSARALGGYSVAWWQALALLRKRRTNSLARPSTVVAPGTHPCVYANTCQLREDLHKKSTQRDDKARVGGAAASIIEGHHISWWKALALVRQVYI